MTLTANASNAEQRLTNVAAEPSAPPVSQARGGTTARPEMSIGLLEKRARRVRRLIVRLAATPSGCHLGGSLSMVEILVALLGRVMRVDPRAPRAPERDHLILSKGHAAAGLYAALAEFGFI